MQNKIKALHYKKATRRMTLQVYSALGQLMSTCCPAHIQFCSLHLRKYLEQVENNYSD